jgi:predicted ferric reductase
MNPQVWWFVSRSSGIVAWALLTLSVCWGLFISTKAVAKASSPAWLLDLHRYLGGLAVIFTGIHLVGLVADNYVTFGWAETFIPMASTWKPGPVAFGIVGFYLLLAVELTSLAMKRLPRRLWRWVHRSSFVLYFVATYHAISAGTDSENQWFRIVALASINIVMFLTIVLILAARKAKLAPARPARVPAAELAHTAAE